MPAPNKAHRQSLRRRARNRPALTLSRTTLAAARASLASPDPRSEEAAGRVNQAIKELARAGRKGIIHKNNAARHISRLMKAANKARR